VKTFTLRAFYNTQKYARNGFTLVELLVSVLIAVIACVCILGGILTCMYLNRLAFEYTVANNACIREAETIMQSSFYSVFATYNNTTFAVAGLPQALGYVYVNNTNPDLLQVWVSVCWRDVGSRVVGEDANLNGTLDAGEDNGNNRVDSPVQISFLMAAR
jgi:prepilin-type N-terminal cleavage/methylation domain-containing protein